MCFHSIFLNKKDLELQNQLQVDGIKIIFNQNCIFIMLQINFIGYWKQIIFQEMEKILVQVKVVAVQQQILVLHQQQVHLMIYDFMDNLNIDENCKNIKELPTLTFILDGIHYDLDAHDYIMKIDSYGNEIAYGSFASTDSFLEMGGVCECIGTFMPLDIRFPQGPTWILGDTFQSKYYSVYNRDNNKVGFARQIHSLFYLYKIIIIKTKSIYAQ